MSPVSAQVDSACTCMPTLDIEISLPVGTETSPRFGDTDLDLLYLLPSSEYAAGMALQQYHCCSCMVEACASLIAPHKLLDLSNGSNALAMGDTPSSVQRLKCSDSGDLSVQSLAGSMPADFSSFICEPSFQQLSSPFSTRFIKSFRCPS